MSGSMLHYIILPNCNLCIFIIFKDFNKYDYILKYLLSKYVRSNSGWVMDSTDTLLVDVSLISCNDPQFSVRGNIFRNQSKEVGCFLIHSWLPNSLKLKIDLQAHNCIPAVAVKSYSLGLVCYHFGTLCYLTLCEFVFKNTF